MANTTLNNVSNTTVTGGVTVTATGGSAYARSPDAWALGSGGKYYFEAKINVSNDGSGNNAVGIGTPSSVFSGGGVNMAVCYFNFGNGAIYVNGSTGLTVGSNLVTNDILCVAIDLGNNSAWFRKNAGLWNNNASANPATNANGVNIPLATIAPCVNLNLSGDGVTCNFGDAAFVQIVPSGFTAGWPVFVALHPHAAYVTQVSIEEFAQTSPQARVSQVALEMWGQTSAALVHQAIVSQVSLEQWVPVVPDIKPVIMKPYAMILA